MIVGNGLIATAFSKSNVDREDIIIYASGISNSNDNSILNCIREKRKVFSLKRYRHSKLIIYFSTTGICDPSQKSRLYIKHKLNMEKYIKKLFDNYLIIRLPIVIGRTRNKHTLINNFVNSINDGKTIIVFSKAVRYFIDIKDVVEMTERLVENGVVNEMVPVIFNNKLKIRELVDILFEITEKDTGIEFIEKGSDHSIDNSLISRFYLENDNRNSKEYVIDTIGKYYGKT